MKALSIFLVLSFFSFNALAVEVCSFQETWELQDHLESSGIKPAQISKNHKRFKFIEKQMIHHAITLDTWASGATREDALDMFERGEGQITYFSIDSRVLAFVQYWPGDNQYGAIYEMRNSVYKVVASIRDSFIECK
jgi:hypothetical protein